MNPVQTFNRLFAANVCGWLLNYMVLITKNGAEYLVRYGSNRANYLKIDIILTIWLYHKCM